MLMPGPDDPPNRRDFDRLERAVDGLITKVDALPEKLADQYVSQKVYAIQQESIKDDIGKVQRIINGVILFVCTGVGAAILGLVLGGR